LSAQFPVSFYEQNFARFQATMVAVRYSLVCATWLCARSSGAGGESTDVHSMLQTAHARAATNCLSGKCEHTIAAKCVQAGSVPLQTIPNTCSDCRDNSQCAQGYCCPFMKKCISKGQSCSSPTAQCKPKCSSKDCLANCASSSASPDGLWGLPTCGLAEDSSSLLQAGHIKRAALDAEVSGTAGAGSCGNKTRALKAKMRNDDLRSYDNHKLACVDCPEFVGLPAKEKENRLWQHVVSDDYENVKTEDRPWVKKYDRTGLFRGDEQYKCYGKEYVVEGGEQYEASGSWKPVTGERTCQKGHTCTCSDDFPMTWFPAIKRVALEGKRGLNGTIPMFFDRFSDVNPAENYKLIHSFGAVAKVKVVMTKEGKAANLGYTGMFANGFDHGLFRLSMVSDFSKSKACGRSCEFADNFKPSMGLKMLRDGEVSSNAVAQVNLGLGVGPKEDLDNGIPGWEDSLNFFKFTHATWLPAPTFEVNGVGALVVNRIFSFASESAEIAGVGIKELASAGAQKGKSFVNAPRMIYFVPTDEMTEMKFSDEDHDPRHDFRTIPRGTAVYKIVALAEGKHCLKDPLTPFYWETLPEDCKGPHLANVVTKSKFVSSDWGDRRLFFQHERLKTKNGKWARKMCSTKDGSDLPTTSEYRMSSDFSRTCTQVCGKGMVEVDDCEGGCPYSYMENDSA